ncbi:MAG: nucleotide sugar dehydrogenase [Bacteroidota bacterium]
MKVGIVGLGYVGLTLSIASALRGIKVFGIEKNKKTLETIKQGKAHFYEPHINEFLELCINRNLFVEDSFTENLELDGFIITIGTPLNPTTGKVNYDYLLSALESISANYSGKEWIVLRSTISVGTTRKIIIPYLAQISGVEPDKVRIAFCPERTIEGKAIEELYSLPQIVGGNNEESFELAANYFNKLTNNIVKVPSLETAELVKLFNNTYRDVHFAMGNAFNEIAQSFGIDGYLAIEASNRGYARSNIALPGYVGGPCLEKDPYILSENMPDHNGKNFVVNSRKYNESLEESVLTWVTNNFPNTTIIGMSGMAFKGVPETSDLRGSVAVNIARKIKKMGYSIFLHDYVADINEMTDLNLGDIETDFYSLVEKTSVILIMNNNPNYRTIDFDKIIANNSRKYFLDSWNVLDGMSDEEKKISVKTLGDYMIEDKPID